eukprot:scaffold1395_cov152-Amphora_coffeaeformis.AAC.3
MVYLRKRSFCEIKINEEGDLKEKEGEKAAKTLPLTSCLFLYYDPCRCGAVTYSQKYHPGVNVFSTKTAVSNYTG